MKGIIFDSELGGGVRLAYKELPAGGIRASQGTFSSFKRGVQLNKKKKRNIRKAILFNINAPF